MRGFTTLFNEIRKSRGIKYNENNVHAFYSFGSPQGMLLDALSMGVVTKPAHQKFLAKLSTVLKVEASLLFIGHLYQTKYLSFAHAQHSMPIEQRLQNLGNLSGIDFSKLVRLYEEMALADTKASYQDTKLKGNNC